MLHLPQTPKSQLSHFVHSHGETADPVSYFDAVLFFTRMGVGKSGRTPWKLA